MNYLAFALILSLVAWHLLFNWTFLLVWGAVVAGYVLLGRRYEARHRDSPHQKWKAASFKDGGDPCVYSRELFDLTETEAFLERFNRENPAEKITLTHIAARALGECLKETKRNCGVISAGHFMPGDSVDVSVLVDIGGNNLGNVVARHCDRASLVEISSQLFQAVGKMKRGKDETLNEQMKIFKRIPSAVLQLAFRLVSFLSYDLGLDVPAIQVKRQHFGQAVLTNVSGMSLRDAIAPLVPFCKPVCVVVMNEPFLKPVVVGDEVRVRRVMYINSSFDHRFADGCDAAKMFAAFRRVFNNPQAYARH